MKEFDQRRQKIVKHQVSKLPQPLLLHLVHLILETQLQLIMYGRNYGDKKCSHKELTLKLRIKLIEAAE